MIRNFPSLAYDCENVFYKSGTHLIKKEIYCDTLYTYINENFVPHSVIAVDEELRITPKVRSEYDGIYLSQNYLNPWNLCEFGDYIYYDFSLPQNDKAKRLAFIGSKDGNLRVLIDPGKDLINDLDGGPVIFPKTILNDKTIVSWIEAIDLKTFVSSETFKSSNPLYPKKKKELQILAESLKDTDNPVLILIKLK